MIRAHNVTTGMTDSKDAFDSLGVFGAAEQMFKRMDSVLEALTIDPRRSFEELENDWTTSMELADTLERQYGVPFRIGHSYASLIVTYARSQGYFPKIFPFDVAQKLYAQAAQLYHWQPEKLPLDEAAFRATLSPQNMVATRVGMGGPQSIEVKRMLNEAQNICTMINNGRSNIANDCRMRTTL
jgi:argininosuccinate lyase